MIAQPGNHPVYAASSAEYRPMLRPGILTMPYNGGLLVEGGVRRRLLSGGPIGTLYSVMPNVLALLDGTHDVGQIATASGADCASVSAFVAMLADAEALDPDRGLQPLSGAMAAAAMAFLSRMNHAASGYRTASELAVALADSAVQIAAPPEIADAIAADLSEVGVGTIIRADGPLCVTDDQLRATARHDRAAVAVFDEGGHSQVRDGLISIAAHSVAYGLPLLRFSCDGAVEIGPVFLPQGTTCAQCFRIGQASPPWEPAAGHAKTAALGSADPAVLRGLAAGAVCAELLPMLTGARMARQLRLLQRLVPPRYQADLYEVLPESGCPRCGLSFSGAVSATSAESYEWLESRAPGTSPDAAVPLAVAESRKLAASLVQMRCIPAAPRFQLEPDCQASNSVGLHEILLGLRQWPSGRSETSTAEDLAVQDLPSAQAYLVLPAGLPGCPATIYRYEQLSAELVAVRSDHIPIASALQDCDLNPDSLECALVLVASVGLLRHVHGSGAIRIGFLSAGRAVADLAAVAGRCGHEIRLASRWSASLADVLELDPSQELIAAVAGFISEGTRS